MKNTICMFIALGLLASCQQADPYDEVRIDRRGYTISLDFTVHPENDEVTYEVTVQNTGGGDLKEVTVIASAYDADGNVFWSERRELDTTGLGSYATKTTTMKDAIPGASEKLDAFNVGLAPDDENSEFKTYKEFMRVTVN